MSYEITQSETRYAVDLMREHRVKPEFECFEIGDIHYLNRLIQSGYTDLNNGPHLIQFVSTFGSNWPTSQFLSTVVNAVPRGCLLGIIAPGAMQFPVLVMALVQGLHVRVGWKTMSTSSAAKKRRAMPQRVEKIVRIANDLGRKVATPNQARADAGAGSAETVVICCNPKTRSP